LPRCRSPLRGSLTAGCLPSVGSCGFETVITASVPRIILSGRRTMMVAVPWVEAGGRFTRSFEGHIIELLTRCRTVKGAARLAGITEDSVDGVLKRAVERGLSRRAIAELKNMGLDEKAIRKGHRYATILTDIDSGAVIDVVEDRTREATVKLLTRLPEQSLAGIEAVAMDMWPAFIGAVEELLPEASIVFDNCCRSRSTLWAAFGWLSPFGRLHISLRSAPYQKAP
jgi:transposase